YGCRARYEQQLCLPAAELARAVPAGLVRAAALTGSDLYWQEGSDVTVLFDVSDRASFLKAQEPFLGRARKAFSKGPKEGTDPYRGIAIESYVPPRREVSLYRATRLYRGGAGDVVVCSNSLAALRRVLDVLAGERPALARSLDFQYMRTVFVRD